MFDKYKKKLGALLGLQHFGDSWGVPWQDLGSVKGEKKQKGAQKSDHFKYQGTSEQLTTAQLSTEQFSALFRLLSRFFSFEIQKWRELGNSTVAGARLGWKSVEGQCGSALPLQTESFMIHLGHRPQLFWKNQIRHSMRWKGSAGLGWKGRFHHEQVHSHNSDFWLCLSVQKQNIIAGWYHPNYFQISFPLSYLGLDPVWKKLFVHQVLGVLLSGCLQSFPSWILDATTSKMEKCAPILKSVLASCPFKILMEWILPIK